jgi:NAD(P)-dependent dehydrogenase (short-subunit alcohol dehydrogenase family)
VEKIALITGGSSGIGLATATLLHKEGYKVIITGRNTQKLDEVRQSIGHNCFAYEMDMSEQIKIPSFVKLVLDKFGKIDVLINNAGVNLKKSLFEVTDQEFEDIIKINTNSIFSLTREVAKHMVDAKIQGSIVNISSMAAHYGLPFVVAYASSKTAVEGMTRALAAELGSYGIRVNTVAPGFIKTPMSSKALDSDPERKNKVLSRTPLGILGEPEDIAHAISFLISEKAKFINGVVLKVDGGNSIGF